MKAWRKLTALIMITTVLVTAFSACGDFSTLRFSQLSYGTLSKANNNKLPDMYVSDDAEVPTVISGKISERIVENEDDALNAIGDIDATLGLQDVDSELESKDKSSSDGKTYYRFSQQYENVPVYGRTVILTVDSDGASDGLSNNLNSISGIEKPEDPVDEKKAESQAKKYMVSKHKCDEDSISVKSEGFQIYDFDEKPYYCYVVLADGENKKETVSFELIVNAGNGKVTQEFSTLYAVKATGQNKDVKRDIDTTNSTLFDKKRNIRVYKYKGKDIKTTDEGKTWSNKSGVDALYNIEQVYDYYKSVLDRKSYDGNGALIKANVSAPVNTNTNAWWDDNTKSFVFTKINESQKERFEYDYAYSLDVVAHEFTHAVIDNTAGLIYLGEPGALSEAICDIMAICVEGENDWKIGEDSLKNGKSLRNHKDTGENPENVSEMEVISDPKKSNDYGNVHTNNTIIGHAAYLMWEGAAGSGSAIKNTKENQKLAKLWYRSMLNMCPTTDFETAAYIVKMTALQMKKEGILTENQVNGVTKAFKKVGLDTKENLIGLNTVYTATDDDREKINDFTMEVSYNEMGEYTPALTKKSENGKVQITIEEIKNIANSGHSLLDLKLFFTTADGQENTYYKRLIPHASSELKSFNAVLPSIKKGTLSGIVYRKEILDEDDPDYEEKIIKGATVSIFENNKKVKTITTDEAGMFETKLKIGKYSLEISAEHYITLPVSGINIKKENEVVYLEKALLLDNSNGNEKSEINGYITNAFTGSGVDNAKIKIRSGWENKKGDYIDDSQRETDYDGYYSFMLEGGYYTFEISRDGFVTGYKNITCVGGNKVNKNVNTAITPVVPNGEVRVFLTWGSTPYDLDSHLIAPGNDYHIYYSNKLAYEGNKELANLDVDDTSSYGPETVTILDQRSGDYTYKVHDFSNRRSDYSTALSNSNAIVKVAIGSKIVATYNVPPGKTGTVWNVFKLNGNDITPINTIESDADLFY